MSASALPTITELKDFFGRLDVRLTEHLAEKREQDRKFAPDFSVLRFMRVDENLLSDILAFLLDPDESHGQGEVFLKVFVNHIGWRQDAAWDNAKIGREVPTYAITSYRRRIDILITAPKVRLAIENKTGTEDSEAQIVDYLTHLKKAAAGGDYCLVFLTPGGISPLRVPAAEVKALQAAGSLRLLSYERDILAWLRACHNECVSEPVRSFLSNIIKYVETNLTQN